MSCVAPSRQAVCSELTRLVTENGETHEMLFVTAADLEREFIDEMQIVIQAPPNTLFGLCNL